MTAISRNMTLFVSQVQDPGHGPPSAGFWAGVGIFVAVALSVLTRYSYLASPHGLQRLKRLLGIRSRIRTPISHYPIATPATPPIEEPPDLSRPERVLLAPGSSEILPPYRPTTTFSSDVLQGLLGLHVPEGSLRPPSYRAKLSLEWEASMGTQRYKDKAMSATPDFRLIS